MITEKQESQLKELLLLVQNYKPPEAKELIKLLNLPCWFDTRTCVIVMNSAHKEQFKQLEVEWISFSEYIMFGEMIVMDKTVPFTPLTTYPKGDMNESLYKRTV